MVGTEPCEHGHRLMSEYVDIVLAALSCTGRLTDGQDLWSFGLGYSSLGSCSGSGSWSHKDHIAR